jgi:hypothetical protein
VRQRLKGSVAVAEGAIASTPVALDRPEQKAILFRSTHAMAADMESGAIAEVAQQEHKPFLVVRAVSDPVGMVMPKQVLRRTDSWGHIRLTRLLLTLFRYPAELFSLIRLGIGYFAALRTLKHTARSLGADGLSPP